MKKYLLLSLILSSMCLSAQDIEVKKFELLEKEKMAVSIRNDNNGNPCALLIVHSLKEGLEFEGWVVGDTERKDDAYWVFVANGAKHIKIKHEDYQTKDIVFGEYGISSLTGGQTYNLQLLDDTKDIVNKVYSLGWNLNVMDVPDNAKTFLRMAATRGDKKAQIAMAQLSLEGNVKAVDGEVMHKGIHWIKKLLAEGDSTCLDQMPGELMYAYALQLMSDAYRSGEISANRSLGRVDTLKERQAYTKISEYEIKACIKGFLQAGNELFQDYLKSNGLPQYSYKIISVCEDSSKTGNVKALKCLGAIYEKGLGVRTDLHKAEKWYKRLYNTNHSFGSDLCRIYGNKSYPIDDEKLAFVRERASEGNEEALFQLGCMYEEGRNVQRDIQKALELYSQCKVHNSAIYRSALLYCMKNEFEKSRQKGELLLRVTNGDSDNNDIKNLYCLRGMFWYYEIKSGYSFFCYGEREKGVKELYDLAQKGHEDAILFLKTNGY